MADAVSIRDLRKSFRGHVGIGLHRVLKGVTLSVPEGVIYGFLGPNGAGKTTTLKILMGLLHPDGGEVSILGRPLSDGQVRRRVGFLPESPYFYDYLTGRELMHFMGALGGVSGTELEDRTAELLATVGLKGKERLQVRKYSKGMLQRLGLAQALLSDPDLVVLDEPMSGLDPVGRREIRDLILQLKARGKTVFFSSHILADAEAICDQVAILIQGEVVKEGPLDALLGPEVRFFDVTLRTPSEFEPQPPCEVLSRQGTHLLVRVAGEEGLQTLLGGAMAAGGNVVAVSPQKASLEDLFLAQLPGHGGAS
jgi:ABC-2 type transport system ATP-binding protein